MICTKKATIGDSTIGLTPIIDGGRMSLHFISLRVTNGGFRDCLLGYVAVTIAAAEDWLVAVVKNAVGSAVTVTTGPHEWDGSFVKNLLTSLPAVVIVLDGGTAAAGTSLTLDATWTLYVVTGWKDGDQASRRRAATTGAYAILQVLLVRLHNTNMGERQYSAQGTGAAVPNIPNLEDLEGFGRIRVTDITNEGSGEWERVGVTIWALELEQQMPLELPVDENLADWLRVSLDIDLPDVGEDVDLEGDFDLPQA